MEKYTIVNEKTLSHYDTDDERFYESSWDRTHDTKEYLETLISNNPDKFKDCIIEEDETLGQCEMCKDATPVDELSENANYSYGLICDICTYTVDAQNDSQRQG